MKKIKNIVMLSLLVSQISKAESVPLNTGELRVPMCNPGPDIQGLKRPRFVPPQEIADMLVELRKQHTDRDLENILGEPSLKSLELYSRMQPKQIYANAYVAAAAAGAAAAAVEYVWDKYVGNGPKDKFDLDEKYFDIQPRIVLPKYEGEVRPRYGKPNIDPVALTPAAVGTAVAGAVAYKAVEYSMKKAFGEMQAPKKIRDDAFDLGPIRQKNWNN